MSFYKLNIFESDHTLDKIFTNVREISEKEFANSNVFLFVPSIIGNTRIEDMEVKVFGFSDQTGYAIGSNRKNGKVRYFAFGCNHSYRNPTEEEIQTGKTPRPSMCFKVSVCKKCGAVNTVDSSD